MNFIFLWKLRTARDQNEVSQPEFYRHCYIDLQASDTM